MEHADDRLGCMLCVRQFPGQIDDLLAKVDCVSQACSEIRSSPMLKIVLEVTLRIGNQLNRLEHGAEGAAGAASAGGDAPHRSGEPSGTPIGSEGLVRR